MCQRHRAGSPAEDAFGIDVFAEQKYREAVRLEVFSPLDRNPVRNESGIGHLCTNLTFVGGFCVAKIPKDR